jgi:hypothetical protein
VIGVPGEKLFPPLKSAAVQEEIAAVMGGAGTSTLPGETFHHLFDAPLPGGGLAV